jgi:hypothetical protein
MAAHEVDHAVMGAPKLILPENLVGFCSEVAIGKKQHFDPLPHLVLVVANPGPE